MTTQKIIPRLLAGLFSSALTLAAVAGLAHAADTAAATAAPTADNTAAAVPASARAQPQDRDFIKLKDSFLAALWREDPDTAIWAGKFESAARLYVPDAGSRAQRLAFDKLWLGRFAKMDQARLSVNQRTDLALINNYLGSSRWYLSDFREFEWNPSLYNVAGGFDVILNTEYAPKAQRVRGLIKRLQLVPAYYDAARASIKRPTPEHTHLAISQSAGALGVLDEVEKAAQTEKLSPAERALLAQRLAAARTAVQGYVAWLTDLEKTLTPENSRSFRIGKALYEGKFAADIQSGYTAEQTFARAVQAKEEAHKNMAKLADELWPKYMAGQEKPEDPVKKIAMVIAKLSENHVKRDEVFNTIRQQIPVLQDWIRDHDLVELDRKKPLIVRETPVYERGVSVASIEAPGPFRPHDNTYYNVTPLDSQTPEQAESTLREYNYWVMQILSIHEGVPGHYVQLQHANKSPSLIKSLFGNGSMVEGWAVYSERMMLESGYGGNTPEMWLMYYKWNLRTVCNTILDYSVHVLGMSEADAKAFLTQQAFQTESEANGKWLRVQYSSVQLASYFSGYSELYEFREQRKKALGDKFNLKQFHEEFLSYGSAPVHVIKSLMLKE
ncbi:DUF885 domain-containing protein [Undibacterium sp. TJN25]|uniref:DUF885 domain-containing protein n=1 Tax=Undibacterium sp. TJN25 TaxID=3413056 RepID=UPI003BF3659E